MTFNSTGKQDPILMTNAELPRRHFMQLKDIAALGLG